MDKCVCYDLINKEVGRRRFELRIRLHGSASQKRRVCHSTTARQILRSGGVINPHRFHSYVSSTHQIQPNQQVYYSSFQLEKNELLACRICF